MATLLEFNYGFQLPLADLKDRFGANSAFGIGLEKVWFKNNIFAGADGMFFFGSTVKEDVVAGLRVFDGSIVGINGNPGDVGLKERGYYIGLNTGKVFSLGNKENNLTGIRMQIGAGFMQHKIRVQDNFRSIVALSKENLKGYDRLTNGPAVHLALGFQYQNPLNNFHFHIMGDVYGASTKSRRDFDYLTGGYLDEQRTDLLVGLRVGYIVMVSRSRAADEIYY